MHPDGRVRIRGVRRRRLASAHRRATDSYRDRVAHRDTERSAAIADRLKLNAAMRIPNSSVLDVFSTETGQTIDSLWTDYIAYLRKG